MIVLGVDPGTYKSGVIVYDKSKVKVTFAEEIDNQEFLDAIWSGDFDHVDEMAIEKMESQGFGIIGKDTFDTAIWIGRFVEAWRKRRNKKEHRISRGDERIVICGRSTYKNDKTGRQKSYSDSDIKRALKLMFPQTGGGKTPSVGKKMSQGPLFLLKGKDHSWQALAVAVTYLKIKDQPVESELGF